jgi:tetratricopeptide (TPR) repeat protein
LHRRGQLLRVGAALAIALSASRASSAASDADRAGVPRPELRVPPGEDAESRIDLLAAGDPRRPERLLDLSLRRHAEAERAEAEERRARAERARPLATPRADAARAEAVRLAERALDEAPAFPGAPEALLVAGLDAHRIGRQREAARWLGALVRGYPDHPLAGDAWLVLGERHLADGDLTGARAALEAAARAGRDAVKALAASRLAEVALAAGDGDGAAAALGTALAAGSVRAASLVQELAAAPWDRPLDAAVAARLGDLAERMGALGQALALRERALAAAPPGALPEVRAAVAAARRALAAEGPPTPLLGGAALRRAARAPAPEDVVALRAHLAAAPGDPAPLHALGLAALDAGSAGEARLLLERAAEGAEGPERAAAEVDLAVALHALGLADAAREACARAAAREPALEAAHEDEGALALALGDARAAEAALAQALALEPWRWEARLLRARALAALDREPEALTEAERVLDVVRGQADALQLAVELRERLAAAPP